MGISDRPIPAAFTRFRRCYASWALRVFCAAFCLAATLSLPGCSMGYANLHPGENSALYHHLFNDVISLYDEPYWLWVRGTISGDLDGNGKVEEELVVATIQKGSRRQPGPIEMAFLVACKLDANGNRQAIARQLLFDRSPIPGAPRASTDIDHIVDNPFTRCRAQMIQDKVSMGESIVVYFWTDPTPCSVWYVGYALKDGKFVKNLETVMWQHTPGIGTVNLDRSIEARQSGYQLVFGVAALPDSVMAKIGKPSEAPLWGHVFARDKDGVYRQADARFAEHYSRLEGPWNQAYLKAIVKGLTPEELAWFEYHLAIMNHYTGNRDMAEAFIAKAAVNAKDPALAAAIPRIEELIKTETIAKPRLDEDEGQHVDWHPDQEWEAGEDWDGEVGEGQDSN